MITQNHREMAEAAERRLMIARSIAIQAYANLEQTLCSLFAHLSGTPSAVAATIFFKMTNAASRGGMLEKLMRLKHGSAHRLFFNSIIKLVKPLDVRRNEIVHWHMVANIYAEDDSNELSMKAGLSPPNFWDQSEGTPTLEADDLMKFEAQCDFVTRAIEHFITALRGETLPPSLLEIFQQPLIYPPQGVHPLDRPAHVTERLRQAVDR